MTEALVIVAVTAASLCIMRIIEELDTPRKENRRKRA